MDMHLVLMKKHPVYLNPLAILLETIIIYVQLVGLQLLNVAHVLVHSLSKTAVNHPPAQQYLVSSDLITLLC